MLRQATTTLSFDVRGRGLVEVTQAVADSLSRCGIDTGLLTL